METTTKKTAETVETVKDHLQEQIEKTATEKVERVKSFKDFGFKRAGQNLGDYLSLKTHLSWIKDGHIVDETFNEKEQHLLKQQAEDKILEKDEERELVLSEKRTAVEVTKPSIEEKIKELKDEIRQTKIDLAENNIITGYQPEKYFIYTTLTVVLSFYLLFFYASTIYASFFRNASSLIATAGNDIALYLDSIFDVKGIFTLSTSLIIVYLGAFLFFAIGLIPHNVEGKNKRRNIVLVVFGAFLADSLLAYKIDSGIHNLKEMAGITDEGWNFYTSVNFYLVLLFGFCAYLVWGYMFELMIKEKSKKTGNVRAELIIEGLKEEIKALREELRTVEAKIIELETKINTVLAQLEQLKKDLESRMFNPDALSQNLTSFYMGWRQFLNGSSDMDLEKEKCEGIFNDFMQSHFNQTPILN